MYNSKFSKIRRKELANSRVLINIFLCFRIRVKKKLLKNEQRTNNTKKPVLGRTTAPAKRSRSVTRLKREFEELGVDMSGTENANFTRTETDRSRSRFVINLLTLLLKWKISEEWPI